MFCKNCGNTLQGDSRFCSQCGTAVDTYMENGNTPLQAQYQPQPQYPPQRLQDSGKGLRTFGIISILLGPILAFIIGFYQYQNVYRSMRFWENSRRAARYAQAAVENIMPVLLLIVAAGLVFGIILLVAGRKKKR